ncbi:lipase [Mycolicibacterium insubricum]|uniref:Lipase n=1 Tax=Mycolicibacterium insubricum TaxID=444597 RepID=A0A1X0DEM5_9MYCO|nr:alpha/beta hydrolase [Mycolicibacterium insubricum]ORA70833.1 lipase [Mycolicibacterium insubricum]BBZ66968.1 lipase [Mycolicibacterium insubricum]
MAAIDDIMQKVLDAVPFQLSLDDGIEAARKRFRELPRRPLHPEVDAQDYSIDGPGGPVGLRIYTPPNAAPGHPVVVFLHGGGFVLGDLDSYDAAAREHAVGADAIVVSVDYRLAPEHPFPAAPDDVWAALEWTALNAPSLGGDAKLIAVAGDSAGANLAAGAALRARDAGLGLAFQLLWYPSVVWDTSLPSFTENADAPILDTATVAAFSAAYARHVNLAEAPATLIPARGDLFEAAPAYIAVAGHDPLRDDGIRYGELLAAAGVPVTVDVADSLVHGYIAYSGVVPAATAATGRGLAALRAALHD